MHMPHSRPGAPEGPLTFRRAAADVPIPYLGAAVNGEQETNEHLRDGVSGVGGGHPHGVSPGFSVMAPPTCRDGGGGGGRGFVKRFPSLSLEIEVILHCAKSPKTAALHRISLAH
ncbi:hypothetical protein SKAU_G00159080 [Synaphobranchus kaupii]|uniref:Uncharacterized protein n=1 Tax=Synaphobranchus kaupii TaxID=118154 RepID=A0A9Q1FIB5_SYNKA|nr:hypothetical protein SKAU_G00159080 [Synaphobranchus kaupii]